MLDSLPSGYDQRNGLSRRRTSDQLKIPNVGVALVRRGDRKGEDDQENKTTYHMDEDYWNIPYLRRSYDTLSETTDLLQRDEGFDRIPETPS